MNIVEMYNGMLTLAPGQYVCLHDLVNHDDVYSSYRWPKVGNVYKIYKISKCSFYNCESYNMMSSECQACSTNQHTVYLEDPDDPHQPICGCYFKMKTVNGIDVGYIIKQMERRK